EASVANTNMMLDLPGFDIAGAMLRTGGNWSLLRKLIIGFVASQQHADTEMAAQLAEGDSESVRLRAHKIKGTGATLGTVRLAAAAGAIDKHIKDNQVPGVALMEEFSAALTEVKFGVESLEKPDQPITKVAVDLSTDTIEEIRTAIDGVEQNLAVNLALVKRHLAQVTTLSIGTPLESFAQQLQQAFDQFRQADLRQLIAQFRAQHATTKRQQ
ncbi:Hpt domain-containing protein, partial [Cellvibrio sp.]